jgi:predicted metal-dependent HD superfamily phosphohydrolase
MKDLERRWSRLVHPGHAGWTWSILRALYAEPHRHYHSMEHIAACLGLLDEVARDRSSQVVELALFWHDAVYVPGDRRNEWLSAELLGGIAEALSVDPAMVGRARAAILATAEHGATYDDDTALVVDIDLSILGTPPPTYARYVQQVRAEWSHVSDEAWRAGRGAFLAGMLRRERLFARPEIRARFEAPARENMQAELAALSPPV